MSARDELLREMTHNHLYMTDERANELIHAFAHELAEEIRKERDAMREESKDPRIGVTQDMLDGMSYAADMIDPHPARPNEESEDDGPESGGHDFQWGDDRVQRCTRCTLPHSQWAGGQCPGPEHPLAPGEYV